MKNNLLLLSVIALLIFACSGENGNSLFSGKSKLPEDPEKLSIEWRDGGGMLPEWETIYISADSSYWLRGRLDYEQKVYFHVTPEELTQLYQVFLDNQFDKIRLIEEAAVCDRGGTSMTINADGEYFSQNNSGGTFVDDNWWDEYGTCSNAICDLAMQKIEKARTPATVKFTDRLIRSGYILSLNINGNFCGDTRDGKELELLDTILYPGLNEFELLLFDPDSLNSYGGAAFITSTRLIKSITETSNIVVFDLKDGVPEAR